MAVVERRDRARRHAHVAAQAVEAAALVGLENAVGIGCHWKDPGIDCSCNDCTAGHPLSRCVTNCPGVVLSGGEALQGKGGKGHGARNLRSYLSTQTRRWKC